MRAADTSASLHNALIDVWQADANAALDERTFAGDMWAERDVQVRQSLMATLQLVAVNHVAASFDIAFRSSKPVAAKAHRTFGDNFGAQQLVSDSRKIVNVECGSNKLVAIEN